MSALTFGSALETPSKQNIIPVVRELTGEVLGFYPIAETTFTGGETTFAVANGTVMVGEIPTTLTTTIAITTITLPQRGDTISNFGVSQYMANALTESQYRDSSYNGILSFVSQAEDLQYQQHSMPTTGARLNFSPSVLTQSLVVGMSTSTGVAPAAPAAVTGANAAMNWSATMELNSTAMQCGFFDFNWVKLFNAQSGSKGVSLELVSNPAGGYFKSTLVAVPVVGSAGEAQYNTVRIVRLKPAPVASYVFTYRIKDEKNTTTTVTLTLTVAATLAP